MVSNKEEFDSVQFELKYKKLSIIPDLLNAFFIDANNSITSLKETIPSKDKNRLYEEIHGIKGVFTTMYSSEITNLSNNLLIKLKNNQVNEVLDNMDQYIDSLNRVIETIKLYKEGNI